MGTDDSKDEKAPPTSGRGGPLGAPGMGNPPEELRPEKDPEEGYAVSGGGMADIDEAATKDPATNPAEDPTKDPTEER